MNERVRSFARSLRPATGSTALLLVACALALALFGLVMTLSSSTVYALSTSGSAYSIFARQAAWIVFGIGVLFVCARVPYDLWRRAAVPILVAAVVLLVLVLVPSLGISVDGSRRWFGAGPLRMQPSELAKLGILLAVALILERRWQALEDPWAFVVPILFPVFAVVAFLLMLEPDFGTTLIVAALVFSMLILAGARTVHLGATFGAAAGLGLIAVLIAPYRLARVTTFLDPWSSRDGAGYQVVQSLIAIGSGGPAGVGLGASRQKWMFLPNAHTDFVFSVVGEELGLLGTLLVLALLAGLVFFCIRAARRAPDVFGMLVAGGIAVWIGVQSILNVGGVVGLLPVDGVPLPLMSVGGSNAVVLLGTIGIAVSIARAGDAAVARHERRERKAHKERTTRRRLAAESSH